MFKLILYPPLIGSLSVGVVLIPAMAVTLLMKQEHIGLFGPHGLVNFLASLIGTPILSLMGAPISLPICLFAHVIIGLPFHKLTINSDMRWQTAALIGYVFALPICMFIIFKAMYPRGDFYENLASALSLSLVGAVQAIATYHYGRKLKPATSLPVTNQ